MELTLLRLISGTRTSTWHTARQQFENDFQEQLYILSIQQCGWHGLSASYDGIPGTREDTRRHLSTLSSFELLS